MGSNPKLGVTNFYVTAQIGVVRPEYAGTLSVCIGSQQVRRQRPLFPAGTTSELYSTEFKFEVLPQAEGNKLVHKANTRAHELSWLQI